MEHVEVPATEAQETSELATAKVEEVTETGKEEPIPPAPAAPAPVEVHGWPHHRLRRLSSRRQLARIH